MFEVGDHDAGAAAVSGVDRKQVHASPIASALVRRDGSAERDVGAGDFERREQRDQPVLDAFRQAICVLVEEQARKLLVHLRRDAGAFG